jgi:hypothetical protein
MPLMPRSVTEFYWEFMAWLRPLGIQVIINTLPSEVVDPIPCNQDQVHASYDPVSVNRFWRVLVQVDKVFEEFRSRFLGKSSPVHFF